MKKQEIQRLKVQSRYMAEPNFNRSLDVDSRYKISINTKRYQYMSTGTGEIIQLDYQKRAVKSATQKPSGLWSGELWTGAGKSYVAAWIAKHLAVKGKTIFICPNPTGMGDGTAEEDSEEVLEAGKRKRGGIIFKFAEIFNPCDQNGKLLEKKLWDLGSPNEVNQLRDLYFFTPHGFVALKKSSPALFRSITDKAHTLIIDEAHHFPEDKDDLVIYGEIARVAKKFFLDKRKKVVTLTATHGRSDGALLIGKSEPDFKMTVQEAVNIGRCPEITGLRIQLSTKAPHARAIGDLFDLKLQGKALGKYLQEVAGRMLSVQEKNKDAKICVFVRSVNEARFLAEIWNAEAKKKGFLPLSVMVGNSTRQERAATKRGIMGGTLQGFVTCNVGAESIDIPPLEIVHLVRRTKSTNLLVQSIGRALRMYEGKRRTLVCDYHVMEGRVIRACKGLADYAVYAGRKPGKRDVYSFDTDAGLIERETSNGGSLVAPEGLKRATLIGTTIAQEKAWVVKHLGCQDSKETVLLALLDFTKTPNRPRPQRGDTDVVHRFQGRSFTGEQFARFLLMRRQK